MVANLILALTLTAAVPWTAPPSPPVALEAHTYEARIRLNGRVSKTQVQASNAGQAKKLVQTQFPTATVLSVKKID